mgnify:CR=1 FL=1
MLDPLSTRERSRAMRIHPHNKTLVALVTLLAVLPALACSADAGVPGGQSSVLRSGQDAAYYMSAIEGVQGPDGGPLGD